MENLLDLLRTPASKEEYATAIANVTRPTEYDLQNFLSARSLVRDLYILLFDGQNVRGPLPEKVKIEEAFQRCIAQLTQVEIAILRSTATDEQNDDEHPRSFITWSFGDRQQNCPSWIRNTSQLEAWFKYELPFGGSPQDWTITPDGSLDHGCRIQVKNVMDDIQQMETMVWSIAYPTINLITTVVLMAILFPPTEDVDHIRQPVLISNSPAGTTYTTLHPGYLPIVSLLTPQPLLQKWSKLYYTPKKNLAIPLFLILAFVLTCFANFNDFWPLMYGAIGSVVLAVGIAWRWRIVYCLRYCYDKCWTPRDAGYNILPQDDHQE